MQQVKERSPSHPVLVPMPEPVKEPLFMPFRESSPEPQKAASSPPVPVWLHRRLHVPGSAEAADGPVSMPVPVPHRIYH